MCLDPYTFLTTILPDHAVVSLNRFLVQFVVEFYQIKTHWRYIPSADLWDSWLACWWFMFTSCNRERKKWRVSRKMHRVVSSQCYAKLRFLLLELRTLWNRNSPSTKSALTTLGHADPSVGPVGSRTIYLYSHRIEGLRRHPALRHKSSVKPIFVCRRVS